MNNDELLAEMKKLNRNLEWLKKKELSTSTKWVRADVIMKRTGWSRTQLAKARRNRYILYNEKTHLYDPGSINQDYLAATSQPMPVWFQKVFFQS